MDLKINLKSVLLPAILTMVLLGGCSAQLATFGLATFGDDRSRGNTIADNEIILDINKRLLSERNRDLFQWLIPSLGSLLSPYCRSQGQG